MNLPFLLNRNGFNYISLSPSRIYSKKQKTHDQSVYLCLLSSLLFLLALFYFRLFSSCSTKVSIHSAIETIRFVSAVVFCCCVFY